jgi:hypothetical protein
MQNISAWAKAKSGQRCVRLLDENPSYVFFREVAPPKPGSLDAMIDGPLGSRRRAALARRARFAPSTFGADHPLGRAHIPGGHHRQPAVRRRR